jgi:pimeloyl-ACP methyl ester carboxylesterase
MTKLNCNGTDIYYEVHGNGPVLLLTHGFSAAYSESLTAADYMAMKIPGARKAVIPAAGHAVNLDKPKAFIEAVQPFLDLLRHTRL